MRTVFRLATLAGDAEAQGKAARWGGRWLFDGQHDARNALALVETARQALAQAGLQPAPELLRLGIECAGLLGEAAIADDLLTEASGLKGVDARSQAILWLHQTDRLMTTGDLAQAESLLRRAETAFRALQDERHVAVSTPE